MNSLAYDWDMTKYSVRLQFDTNRKHEDIEKYFAMVVRGLKAPTEPKLVIEKRTRSGKVPVQQQAIWKWIRRRTKLEPFTVKDVADGLNISKSTVWRVLNRMADAEIIDRDMIMTSTGQKLLFSKIPNS